jgi:hypothetical protein
MNNLEYGDYRIHPITINGKEYDGVYYFEQITWLGKVLDEIIDDEFAYRWVYPAQSASNEPISAPSNWTDLIIEYIGPPEV